MCFSDPECYAGWDACIPSRFNNAPGWSRVIFHSKNDPWSSTLWVGRQAKNLLSKKQQMLQKHVQEI